MIRKDIYGDYWFTDDYDDDAEPINLTEIFGNGSEPQTDDEVRKIIKQKKGFFRA